ncbi:hypothetical protein OH76DRAFT_1339039, partial [Lentinus brumalis]
MWLKEYLTLSPGRPKWAFIADILYARAKPSTSQQVEDGVCINPFLQTWKVSTHHTKGLPADLTRLIKAAEKYNIRAAVRDPDETLKGLMPGWFHVGLQPGRYVVNSAGGRCLRENHRVLTIADCCAVAARLVRVTGTSRPHRPTNNCACHDCECDRVSKRCDNPHRCATAAMRTIERLELVWKPENGRAKDDLTLRTSARRRNKTARENNDEIVFDPTVTDHAPIAGIFRAFVTGNDAEASRPARRPPRPFNIVQETITAYTDGSAKDGDAEGPRAGGGIWCGENHPLTASVRVPPNLPQTNQVAEVYAVSAIAAKAPPFAPLIILSD